ncbi:MAG: GIY-YIG nuclease family protein [bacterium]|nr:GIY-YIG nuclease family protein [bacterium]
MFFAYVIQNPKGVLYKGHTTDLEARIRYHNLGNIFSRYTKNRGPWKLVYHEEFQTAAEAIIRERFFKSGQGREFLKKLLKRDPSA